MTNSNKEKYSILQVLPALNAGGVERGVVDLCNYAASKGYKMIVASSGGVFESELNPAVTHIKLNLKTKNPFKIIKNAFALNKICKQHNVCLMHARSRAPAWSVYLASKFFTIPFISTFHGFYKFNFPLKKIYNKVMTKGDIIIAVSHFIKQHIIENYNISAEKITVIHRGINPDFFSPEKISEEEKNQIIAKYNLANSKVIFMPSRITRWKGADYLIKALPLLKTKNNKLVIAGDFDKNDNFFKELQAIIDFYELEERVIFTGIIKNINAFYEVCDVVINCSVEPETFGRTTAEAGAMGKLVVATNIGGSNEIVIDGKTGFLALPANEKSLAEKIDQALEYQANHSTDEIYEVCRKNIEENFSLKQMCEKNLIIYDKYLNN